MKWLICNKIYNTPLYTTMNVYKRACHFKVEKNKYMVKNIFFMQILIYWSEIIMLGQLITTEFLSLDINMALFHRSLYST